MAWIRMLDEAEVAADPQHRKLARLYRACVDEHTGRLDNVLKVHSLVPATMDGHLKLYRAAMKDPGETSERQRELIGVVVSAVNACHY
jgi:hypothetical protein